MKTKSQSKPIQSGFDKYQTNSNSKDPAFDIKAKKAGTRVDINCCTQT